MNTLLIKKDKTIGCNFSVNREPDPLGQATHLVLEHLPHIIVYR